MQMPNYYKILGIQPESDSQIIRDTINLRMRKVQAQMNSPDKNIRHKAEKELKELIEARRILLDAIKREEYDNKLKKSFEVDLKTLTDSHGKKITVDHLERPVKIIYSDGRTISYIYDEVGNITEIADSELGTITFQYDLLDRLTKVTYPGGHIFSYTYNAMGNRNKVTYPNGEAVYYNYNPNNWLIVVIAGSKKTRFEYDKLGNLVKKILPNGIIVSHKYDAGAKLSNLKITNKDGYVLYNFSYDFDAVGNCLAIKRFSKNSNGKTSFKYDPLYRLIETNYYNGKRVNYKYDEIGNRLSAKAFVLSGSNILVRYLKKPLMYLPVFSKKTRYNYDSQSRLMRAGDIQFRYDDNGNLIEKKRRNKITRYFYNDDGRLIKIEHPDGTCSEYRYDALGRRVSKKDKNGRIRRYLYDGYNLCQELDDKGRVIASYVYDLGIDHPISMTRDGKTYYFLCDHLGSAIALTDDAGNILSEYEYDAWGNIIKEVGEIENPFRYTGREWHEESGLYYYRARFYDPTIGRFLSEDPIGIISINPFTSNRYAYVENNPQGYIDPLGLQSNPIDDFASNLFGSAAETLTDLFSKGHFTPPIVPGRGGQYLLNFPGLAKARSLGKFLGGPLKSVVDLTGFLPHIFNPDRVQGFIGATDQFTSMFGGALGASKGAAIGATLGAGALGIGAIPGAIIGGAIGGFLGSQTAINLRKFITNTAMTGGQNILNPLRDSLNAVQSHVGGVLFDKAAEVLTDLEGITGAYWDDKLGQIVLFGKQNEKMEEWFLPKMDKDHLAVAIKAVFSGDNLGVSIDPPPSYLESGEFPPDGTEMLVRYLGNTKDTLFGAIMFEADRLLKNLSMGIDNECREEMSAQVQGFQNELDLSLKYGTEKKRPWHRMWFVIEKMRVEMPVKETSDRNALTFGKATLKVKAEYLSQEKNPGADPIAKRFAEHFTSHFDEFAKEFPILERLRELAKISAVVKWLKNTGKPIDLSFLNDYEFIKVPTPEETPGITASKSKTWQSGNTTHTQTYSLYGGVDFDFQFQAIEDDGEALALKKASQESKPCETALSWDFETNGKIQKALAMPLSKTNGNFTTVHIDFSLSSTDGTSLEFARYYDSLNIKPSIFGYGWAPNIPYELFVLNPQKNGSPLLIIDKSNGRSHKFIFVEDSQAYYLVKEEKEEQGQTYFSYDPQNFIKKNSENVFVWQSQEGLTYSFDYDGKLISKLDVNNHKLDYVYEDNKLVKILDSKGKTISLIYDDKNRVRQVIAPGQTTIDYFYDCRGDLIRVSDNKGNIKNYVYDDEHRLIKHQDGKGRTIFRNSYDPLGRIVDKRSDKVTIDGKNIITRTYDDNHQLIQEKDQEGNTVVYEYDKNRNMTRSVINDTRGRKVTIDYDRQERISRIANPMGNSLSFTYDTKGNINSVAYPNGHSEQLKYDGNNNPISLRDAMGNEWRQEFDHLSRLKSFIDPLGNKMELNYTKDNLIESIISPHGTTQYKYDNMNRLIKIIDPNGNSTEFSYDSKGKLTMIKDALGGQFKYQ